MTPANGKGGRRGSAGRGGKAVRGGRFTALRPWLLLAAALAATLALWLANRPLGEKAVTGTLASLKEMLFVLPPIFIILGLLDVWVPRERMVKYLGEGSGIRGAAIAFVLGSAAAGPLYGAFPVAQVLLKKGSSMRNVLVLLGAWSTTKIPMLMFEYANLGARFTFTRLAVDLVGIMGIAWLMDRLLGTRDREEIQAKALAS
jgi:uncharacterized membrane protein YraQ (UPF0718 family)